MILRNTMTRDARMIRDNFQKKTITPGIFFSNLENKNGFSLDFLKRTCAKSSTFIQIQNLITTRITSENPISKQNSNYHSCT